MKKGASETRTQHLAAWQCRNCDKTFMEYNRDTRGVQIKICDRCKTVNVLVDGVPQK